VTTVDLVAELAAVRAEVALRVPERERRPIVVVGAGAIVDTAHLPAYRAGGLPVVGLLDVDRPRAEEVAARHGIDRVYPDLATVLADPDVEVVDVAVPAIRQPAIVAAALGAGKHVLAQKPFAPDVATGQGLVRLAEERSRVLAVNQQLRFDEGAAAAYAMVRRGWVGQVSALTVAVDIWTPWSSWPWLLEVPRLEILYHSIHYHDLVRWFLGEPEQVFCLAGRRPEQTAVGETRTVSSYRYRDDLVAVVAASHANRYGDARAEFRIEGTEGVIKGTFGLLYDYPTGRPDTLEITSRVLGTDGWLPYPVTTRWIPDAFLGPMASLLAAVAGGPPPRSSGRDNLGTLRLVEALYASADTGESVALGTAAGDDPAVGNPRAGHGDHL
jgi:predicted dehydrogenase